MPSIQATYAFIDPAIGVDSDVAIELHGEIISRLLPGQASRAGAGRTLVLPAFANGHDHARPLAMSSFGAAFMPLETWLPRSMLATPPDAYLAALAPLARAARSGCASVMVHYTRPSGRLSPVDEAREVARAAADIGVRIAYAPALRDRNPLVYGDEAHILARLSPETAALVRQIYCQPSAPITALIETTEAIAQAIEGPMVDVQFGPAAVQWCSPGLLEAIAARSAETGRRVHMHLLETIYQREWADRNFPQGIVTYLKEIGLLSPRLALAHCIHARPDELDLIAEAGATIVTNSSSNMHLRSGIGPIADAYARGCRIAVGMDGLAFDEDDDMVRETRLANALHGGSGFKQTWHRPAFLAQSIAHGRAATGAPGTGRIALGAAADLVVIDYDQLDRDRIMDVNPIDLLFARADANHIMEVIVAGRTIVKAGGLLGIDLDAVHNELRARYRSETQRVEGLRSAWPTIGAEIEHWFHDLSGCC
ncbi:MULTISPECIES: amidohydrolase family protein [unclassified Devosia]|uniref:amidohydrolase family protein n=1 Tax=unclassified Devosia TaxID=196773 RepID=UPI0015553441|nr:MULTISPECIES: amidohydrolase family protein [unclassified Devosia]